MNAMHVIQFAQNLPDEQRIAWRLLERELIAMLEVR